MMRIVVIVMMFVRCVVVIIVMRAVMIFVAMVVLKMNENHAISSTIGDSVWCFFTYTLYSRRPEMICRVDFAIN